MIVEPAVTILGGYGLGNLGDDALMGALIRGVRSVVDDSEICVKAAVNAEYLERHFPDIRFVSNEFDGLIKTKVLLYGGGTQFYSFPDTIATTSDRVRRAFRLMTHPRRLWLRLRGIAASWRIESEYSAAISIGVGPFVPNSRAETCCQKILKSCEWISIRDSFGFDYCKRLGICNLNHYADLCFARELWDESHENSEIVKGPMKHVGVIVRDWPHSSEGRSYLGPLRNAVKTIRGKGISAYYVSFASSDRKTVSELRSQGEDVLQWHPDDAAYISGFVSKLCCFDLLVTARAHGVIIGAALGIPSIAIEIEPKLRLICERLNKGTRLWSAPFDANTLIGEISTMAEALPACQEIIESEARTCADEARKSLEQLKAFLKSVL